MTRRATRAGPIGREIPPMTLANMREHSVRSVTAHCQDIGCGHAGWSMWITCPTMCRCPMWRCVCAARPAARGTSRPGRTGTRAAGREARRRAFFSC
jgi:hypothetical protein